MTNFEIILVAIVWIGYGLFAAYQSRGSFYSDAFHWFFFPALAPIIFVIRALYGAFKKYE